MEAALYKVSVNPRSVAASISGTPERKNDLKISSDSLLSITSVNRSILSTWRTFRIFSEAIDEFHVLS